MNVKELFKTGVHAMEKHAPELLIGSGMALLIGTNVLTVKATVRAYEKVKAEEARLGRKLTKKEIFALCWKDYTVPAASVVVGTGMGIAGTAIGSKRNAVLITAATMGKIAEDTLGEYKEVIEETVTKAKNDEINAKVAEKHFEKDEIEFPFEPVPEGMQWFRDSLTGQRLLSTVDAMEANLQKVNNMILKWDEITLNEFLETLGFEGVADGDFRHEKHEITWYKSPVVLPGGKGTGFELQYRGKGGMLFPHDAIPFA